MVYLNLFEMNRFKFGLKVETTNKPFEALGKRLEAFRSYLKVDKKTMAEGIGMQPQHYRNVVNGYKNITTRYLIRLATNHKELNLNWLLTGEGDMLNRAIQQAVEEEIKKLQIENNLLRDLLRPDRKE